MPRDFHSAGDRATGGRPEPRWPVSPATIRKLPDSVLNHAELMNGESPRSAIKTARRNFATMDFIVANPRRIHAVQAMLFGIKQNVKKRIHRVANKPVRYGTQNAEQDSKELLHNALLYAQTDGTTSVFPAKNLAVLGILNHSLFVQMVWRKVVQYVIRLVSLEVSREPRKLISMPGPKTSIKAWDRFAGRIARVSKMSIVGRAVQRLKVNVQKLFLP